ncbi:hypothetical protein CAL29_16845 [Bordetella genomosp. 10]|uniref:Autotransporter domain-containing protein n=1 Tax=Bordetella genomosp. 10 TaxID=1416804 RepID=A0A261RXI7_9BORD|nr:autotransporter-associated beta strand repeat-containing protein [Bordetella genomosp. 10]OZI29794.1 hypothetical protein CAL29_16845 [Bordetella genomosp. 10]
MNHAYRLVFNCTLGLWQAVAETARGRGKAGRAAGALTLVLAAASSSPQARADTIYYLNAAGATVAPSGGTYIGSAALPWTPGALYIGNGAASDLTIENGGVVNDTGAGETASVVGASSTGSVTVTGSGSAWNAVSGIFVGEYAAGSLTIQNGGMVNAGRLLIGNGSGLPGAVTVESGGALTSMGLIVVSRFDSTGTLDILNGGTVSAIDVIVAQDAGGTGTLTLDGSVLHTGSLGKGLGSGQVNIGNGGTLQAGSSNASFLTGFDVGQVTLGTGGGVIDSNGFDIGVDSALGGAGSLTKAGAGTLTLSGTNTYTGGTTINGGTLALGSAGALGTTGAISFGGGTLQYSASNNTDYSSRFSTAANQQYRIDTNGENVAFATGLTSAGGSLTKLGSGTLLLTGVSTYTGATTISGGTLQLGDGTSNGSVAGDIVDNAALVFANGTSQTYSGAISGAGSLTKAGAGTLILRGTNTYSGDTRLDAGTLSLQSSQALGPGTISFGGGTLQYSASNTTDYSFRFSAAANQQYRIDTNGENVVFAAGLNSGGGSLTKLGAGTLTLTGWSNYNGATTISAGTLQLGDGTSLGNVAGDIVDNAALVFDNGTPQLYSGAISGTGSLTKAGAGPLFLLGTNTYSGGTRLDAGTLSLLSPQALGLAGTISFGGGTLQYSASNTTDYSSRFSTAAGQQYRIDTNVQNVVFATALTSPGGNLVKQGAGRLSLTGTNTYGGGTVITAGTLALSDGGSLSPSGDVTLIGGSLDISGIYATSATIGALSGNAGTTVLLGAKDVILNNATDTLYAGSISSTAELIKAGAGTLTLSGTNAYGGTAISGGTLQIDATGSITGNVYTGDAVGHGTLAFVNADTDFGRTFGGDISGSGRLAVTGFLTLTGASDHRGGTTIGTGGGLRIGDGGTAGSISGDIANNGVLAFDRSDDIRYAGSISGAGAVWKQGAGTATLTGADSFGSMLLYGGTVQVGDGGTAGSIDGDVNTGASSASKGTLAFKRSDAVSFGGAISGFGGVVQDGTGTLTLSGANTYTGATVVNAGTLQAGAVDVLGDGSAVTVASGARLDLDSKDQRIGSLAGAGDVLLGAATLTAGGDGASTTFSGALSGSGGLAKQGAGMLTLTGANTYAGVTTIGAGTLRLGDGASNGSVAGDIVDNAVLVFDNGSAQTYGGAIGGTGSLTKQGAGTLTLTGANSYEGGTLVLGGELVAAGASLPGDAEVGSGAFITFQQDASGSYTGVISGAGGVQKLGNGTLVFTAVQNYTGGTHVDAGALQATTAMLQGDIAVAADAALVFNQAIDGDYAGQISGGGALLKAGTGTVTLTAANRYSGPTAVLDGTLVQGADHAFVSNGAYVVNGGTLDLHGYDLVASSLTGTGGAVALGGATLTLDQAAAGSYAGAITGQGNLVKDGAGTLTLAGRSDYSGATALRAGVLKAGADNVFSANSAVTIASAATLDLGNTKQSIGSLAGAGNVLVGSGTLTAGGDGTDTIFSGALSGSGGLTKQGGGLLILNGDSAAFTGATTVAGGELEVGDIDTPSAVLGGNVAVEAAGTLRGHGAILGNVENAGTVAPGGSIGTLTVGGNYTQASDATLRIEVSPTQASQLKVGGTASLAGTLALVYDPGTYSARSYTIVSAAGGVSGAFDTVSSTGASALGTLAQTVSVGGNTVDLVLAEPGASETSPPAAVVVAPTQTSIYTALGTTALLGAQSASGALLDRAGSGAGMRSAQALAMEPGSSVWATLTGNYTRVGGNSGAPGFQSQRYGFLAGHDRPAGPGVLGVAFGYDHADIQERGTGSSGKLDTVRLGVYGGRAAGPFVLGATAGVGLNFLSQKRPFDAVGTAEGNHTGQEATLGLQAGLPLQLGARTLLTPKLGLRYAYVRADSFNEKGASGQNLHVGTDNIHSLQPYVGLALDQAFGDDANPMNAQVRVGYAREVLDANRAIGVTSQDGTPFTATGASLPRGSLTAGASFTLHPRKNLDVSLNYDALINTGGASGQQGSLRVAYRF